MAELTTAHPQSRPAAHPQSLHHVLQLPHLGRDLPLLVAELLLHAALLSLQCRNFPQERLLLSYFGGTGLLSSPVLLFPVFLILFLLLSSGALGGPCSCRRHGECRGYGHSR